MERTDIAFRDVTFGYGGDEDGGTPLPPDGGGKDPNRLRSQFVISGFEKNPCHQVSA